MSTASPQLLSRGQLVALVTELHGWLEVAIDADDEESGEWMGVKLSDIRALIQALEHLVADTDVKAAILEPVRDLDSLPKALRDEPIQTKLPLPTENDRFQSLVKDSLEKMMNILESHSARLIANEESVQKLRIHMGMSRMKK